MSMHSRELQIKTKGVPCDMKLAAAAWRLTGWRDSRYMCEGLLVICRMTHRSTRGDHASCIVSNGHKRKTVEVSKVQSTRWHMVYFASRQQSRR
mmetsp:Transcript_11004/g.23624  ORF Transcript_11004/g.23624 Transcript_11004/m.23624 type:complete len:94 (-) Transcript_11004:2297-2578(-)